MGKAKDVIHAVVSSSVRLSLALPPARQLLNSLYNQLSYDAKSRFYWRYAKMYRDRRAPKVAADWKINFAGTQIRLPLETHELWLDWDLAVSFLGHDTEIKQTYEYLLGSPLRPKIFFDIGANFGTDSLFFLANGVKTISFEPNPNCHEYLLKTAKMNGLTPQIEQVALADTTGEVTLSFPKGETWLGSIDHERTDALKKAYDALLEIKVRKQTLDSYVEATGLAPGLIKIDTEGNELKVLQGATKTLANHKPPIVFESFLDEHRGEIFDFFSDHGYAIYALPYSGSDRNSPVYKDTFQSVKATNFLAIPAKQ